MTDICPGCGLNLKQDELIIDGDWSLDPRGVSRFQGVKVASSSSADILYALAKAGGRPLNGHAIVGRLQSNAHEDSNVVGVLICRLRTIFKDKGIPWPVETIGGGRGWAWQPRAVEQQAEASQPAPSAGAPVNFQRVLNGDGRVSPKFHSDYG